MQYWVINGKCVGGSNPSVAVREYMRLKNISFIKVGGTLEVTRITYEKYLELVAALHKRKEEEDD